MQSCVEGIKLNGGFCRKTKEIGDNSRCIVRDNIDLAKTAFVSQLGLLAQR